MNLLKVRLYYGREHERMVQLLANEFGRFGPIVQITQTQANLGLNGVHSSVGQQ